MNGVPVGPRSVLWQALKPATLVWVEALDGGDTDKAVPFHDKILTLPAPFTGEPKEVFKSENRFAGLTWFGTPGLGRRFRNEPEEIPHGSPGSSISTIPLVAAKKLFDLNTQDAYDDPGNPVMTMKDGDRVILQDKDWIYLTGAGASPKGDHPFLDRMNLKTGEKAAPLPVRRRQVPVLLRLRRRRPGCDHHQPGIQDRGPELSSRMP